MEELTPEEKEAFLARVRAQGRSLTSAEQYAIFGPPREKVDAFRESEVVEEAEPARLDSAQVSQLAEDFFPELRRDPLDSDPLDSTGGAGAVSSPLPGRLVHGIVFDFDDTLAVLTRPQDELLQQGAREALAYMRSTGMELPDTFAAHMVDARRFAERKSVDESEEHIADDALSFLLQFFGFPTSRMDPAVLHRAVDIFYAYEMTAWQLRPDAIPTLKRLRELGFHIAVLANYNADRVFQRSIDYLGLRPYLDLCISSAAVEYRKPDPAFFQIALDHWGAMAYEVVVVGDSLKDDVAGAIETGCLSVFLDSGSGAPQVLHDNRLLAASVHPDARIESLSELPALVQEWAAP